MKQVKESIMVDEIANKDIGNTAKNAKSSEEAMEIVKEMEKVTRSNKYCILWLAYQQGQIFERYRLNGKFINMANNQQVYYGFYNINRKIFKQIS